MSNKNTANTSIDSEKISEFRKRMRYLRTTKKESQENLSEILGTARQTVAKYETPDTRNLPEISTFCTLCDHYNVTPNYLLGYSDITCDTKENYGLSDQTINLLHLHPKIHHFFDYFVEQLVNKDLVQVISQIGITNNVETVWERVFPQDLLTAIHKAYSSMVKKAAFSICINSEELEKELRVTFPDPKPFSKYFNESLEQDGRNFILSEVPDFNNLSDKEQYDCFIKIISSEFLEVESVQYVYNAEHEKLSQKIIDIVDNYRESFLKL